MDTLTLIIEVAMVCGLIGRDVDNTNGATGMSRADAEAFTASLVELDCRRRSRARPIGAVIAWWHTPIGLYHCADTPFHFVTHSP
jgi:hypothetical protein